MVVSGAVAGRGDCGINNCGCGCMEDCIFGVRTSFVLYLTVACFYTEALPSVMAGKRDGGFALIADVYAKLLIRNQREHNHSKV